MTLNLYGWPTDLCYQQNTQRSVNHQDLKFSIVIPTLNQADTLEHTLLSIINQDYSNFEIIIIDGGSNDNTSEIIKKYKDRISYFASGRDSGQSDAINKGFEVASGNIYAWINSDDFYLPFAFSRVSRYFHCNAKVDMIVGAGDVVSRECKFLKHISPMPMNRENMTRWVEGKWIMQQSCFWTDNIWKMSGGVDQKLKLLMDIDLWFRFARIGKSGIINEPLAAMRYYPEVKTVSLRDVVKEETAYVFAKNKEFDEVKKIVSDLVIENKAILAERKARQDCVLQKILQRIRKRI
jgi:glycosyltransferase involved in cell wall biosynthesis